MSQFFTKDQYLSLVDHHCGYSDWIEITQSMISEFAELTADRNPVHMDTEAAKERGFETTIAHGMLTLSLAHGLAYEAIPKVSEPFNGLNIGFDKVRFLEPLPCGSRIRAGFTVKHVVERSPGRLDAHIEMVVEIAQKERPAVIAEWRILVVVP
jgi:acyl dehydratase